MLLKKINFAKDRNLSEFFISQKFKKTFFGKSAKDKRKERLKKEWNIKRKREWKDEKTGKKDIKKRKKGKAEERSLKKGDKVKGRSFC